MSVHRQQQVEIFRPLLNDARLTGAAKNQIRIFIDILESDSEIGFDTTSALFYGFLQNHDFVHPSACPLSKAKIEQARQLFRERATIQRAKEYSLLQKVLKLPMYSLFGKQIDLNDLAVSLLTYVSTESHFTFNPELVAPLYKYLDIPDNIYLNVYDLYYDIRELNIDFYDLIINLSRLRFKLVPPTVKSISVVYRQL